MRPGTSSIGGATMHWLQTVDGRVINHEAEFYQQELHELFRLLNAVNLPALSDKKYMQSGLADEFNEVLTLRMSNHPLILNRYQSFVVENYGNKAPAAYYKVTEYLRQLQAKKFPAAG